jgi:hypothetical protein
VSRVRKISPVVASMMPMSSRCCLRPRKWLNYPEGKFTNLLPGSRLSTVVIDEEIDYAARHRRRRRQRIGAALVAAGFAAATVIPSISAIF